MNIFKTKLVQRKLVSVSLGLFFGFVCVFFASKGSTEPIWGTPLMWQILYNRMLIGVVVMIMGVFNWHSFLGMRFSPWLRGLWAGAIVSLDMAIGIFIASNLPAEQVQMVFWSTIGMGAIYGMLIDVIATKLTGEGKELLKEWSK